MAHPQMFATFSELYNEHAEIEKNQIDLQGEINTAAKQKECAVNSCGVLQGKVTATQHDVNEAEGAAAATASRLALEQEALAIKKEALATVAKKLVGANEQKRASEDTLAKLQAESAEEVTRKQDHHNKLENAISTYPVWAEGLKVLRLSTSVPNDAGPGPEPNVPDTHPVASPDVLDAHTVADADMPDTHTVTGLPETPSHPTMAVTDSHIDDTLDEIVVHRPNSAATSNTVVAASPQVIVTTKAPLLHFVHDDGNLYAIPGAALACGANAFSEAPQAFDGPEGILKHFTEAHQSDLRAGFGGKIPTTRVYSGSAQWKGRQPVTETGPRAKKSVQKKSAAASVMEAAPAEPKVKKLGRPRKINAESGDGDSLASLTSDGRKRPAAADSGNATMRGGAKRRQTMHHQRLASQWDEPKDALADADQLSVDELAHSPEGVQGETGAGKKVHFADKLEVSGKKGPSGKLLFYQGRNVLGS
ncbi:hypothetical protein LTR36_010069 [Oleoguttula mirabilis]|uniref:Uncharacterized protein n=1 Tax=Oleoguttula mirabilis TaxID=1507867 RepID=A0AAV9JRV7_9PEZI|nr:hypothetical protein LTR36_010069 [Oleoguttula mirabilis]